MGSYSLAVQRLALVPLTVLVGLVAACANAPASLSGPPTPDYEFYKVRVQPIFMVKKPGMISCMNCHRREDRGWPLEMPPRGVETFTEAQSRHNYDVTLVWIKPGNPDESRLLTKPLARDAGGDAFHGGGKAWMSKSDPEWRTIADWIRGQRLSAN